jgi:hypothetical protein
MRKLARTFALAAARLFGTRVIDLETGRDLGRIVAFAWRGKVHVIGLDTAVRPMFLPQARVTYWKQEIGFARHRPPDFPSCAHSARTDANLPL